MEKLPRSLLKQLCRSLAIHTALTQRSLEVFPDADPRIGIEVEVAGRLIEAMGFEPEKLFSFAAARELANSMERSGENVADPKRPYGT